MVDRGDIPAGRLLSRVAYGRELRPPAVRRRGEVLQVIMAWDGVLPQSELGLWRAIESKDARPAAPVARAARRVSGRYRAPGVLPPVGSGSARSFETCVDARSGGSTQPEAHGAAAVEADAAGKQPVAALAIFGSSRDNDELAAVANSA